MVVLRWLFVALVLFVGLAASVFAVDWGCCVPEYNDCFNGDLYDSSSESAFISACNQENGDIQGAGAWSTCDGVPACELGCCCANTDVDNSGQWNIDEAGLYMTTTACDNTDDTTQGTFYFLERDPTCVEICGGQTEPPSNDNHTVSGTITDETGTPKDQVEAFIPVPNGLISDFTDSSGVYLLETVPEISASVFAIHPECVPGQSGTIFIDRDLTDIDIELDCTIDTCDHDAPVIEDINIMAGELGIALTVSITDTCGDFVQYEPWRCDADGENCNPLPFTTSPAIPDQDPSLQSGTTYCYFVDARFGDGSIEPSSQSCITTGSEECLNAPGGQWCGVVSGEQAIVTCDVNNALVAVETCETLEVCSDVGGQPACIAAPHCDQCNGLLGLFSKLDIFIGVGGLIKECGTEEVPLCYLDIKSDGNPLLVDAYSSCLAISKCGDYAGSDSCSDNPCGIADNCAWTSINDELGQGICLGDSSPPCGDCEDLFGYCSKSLCTTISPECYYDGLQNGLSDTYGCIHKDDMACRYYDEENDCTAGGSDAQFNIVYDSNDERIGGDNSRTVDSQDLFNFSVCTWVDDKNRCIKDADMMTDGEGDCIENGRFNFDQACVRDLKPPVTTFYLLDPPVYGYGALRSLPFGVVDDRTSVDDIVTYVCFADRDATCYPTETIDLAPLPDEGSKDLYYYSIDQNGNSEELKHVAIEVANYGDAALSYITIIEDD